MNKSKKEEILEKAKRTPYKHSAWYKGQKISVYKAIKHYVDTRDFYLDIPRTLTLTEIRRMGYQGEPDKSAIIQWLKSAEKYDTLRIRFAGSEGGTDKGVLKVKTFIILKNKK